MNYNSKIIKNQIYITVKIQRKQGLCSEGHRKCKECKLDKSKEVIQMIEDEERYIDIGYMNKLKRSLPIECKNCTQLKIINLRQQKVYCPYRIKDRCMLRNNKRII